MTNVLPSKIRKRLDFSRSCFYDVGTEMSQKELNDFEVKFRSVYRGEFYARIGKIFFWEFRTKEDRDWFLNIMKENLIEHQFIFKEEVRY